MEDTPNKEGEEFYNYRTSKVVAIVDNKAQADAATVALARTGFTDDVVEVFIGLKGEHDLDLKGEYHGYLHHVRRKLHHFMLMEGLQMDCYERSLLAGCCVIQVHTDFHNKEQAHERLKSCGGRFINFYGHLTTQVLEP